MGLVCAWIWGSPSRVLAVARAVLSEQQLAGDEVSINGRRGPGESGFRYPFQLHLTQIIDVGPGGGVIGGQIVDGTCRAVRGPDASRSRCGTTSPTNATVPATAVANAAITVASASILRRNDRTSTPRLCASSPPSRVGSPGSPSPTPDYQRATGHRRKLS